MHGMYVKTKLLILKNPLLYQFIIFAPNEQILTKYNYNV